MLTTVLNPTLLLLAGLALTALVGTWRSWTARESLEQFVRLASTRTVIVLLLVLTAVAVASRIVLGLMSPGAYAEEVLAARTFLEQRRLYSDDSRSDLAQWLEQEQPLAWELPGTSPCQDSAMAQRARFYTSHAHMPTLLLASVPIVHLLGGRGLYLVLLGLSALAVAAIARVLLALAGCSWRSRSGLLIVIALCGWQPVLAGLKQGDAVLVAAALVVFSWHWARLGRSAPAALAGGLSICLALPSAGVLPALVRWKPRAGLLASTVPVGALGLTALVAGPLVLADFGVTLVETARTYAAALPNYAVLGRAIGEGVAPGLAATCLALALAATMFSRRTPDQLFPPCILVGLAAMPLLWSQHMALTAIPAVILLQRVLRQRSAVPLFVWACLVLLLSLPDPAVFHLNDLVPIPSPSGATVPIVPFALASVWLWLLVDGSAQQARARADVTHLPLSV